MNDLMESLRTHQAPASGIEMPLYCSEVRWAKLFANTSPVRSSAASPETSRTDPSGVSVGFSAAGPIRFSEVLRLLPQEFLNLVVRELGQL